jgi:hypothetical protein
MKISIYKLIDPFTREVRYVGKTKKFPVQRLAGHISERTPSLKKEWIKSIIEKGVTPEIVIIEEVDTPSKAAKREKHWIKYHLDSGCKLLNVNVVGRRINDEHILKYGEKTVMLQFRVPTRIIPAFKRLMRYILKKYEINPKSCPGPKPRL